MDIQKEVAKLVAAIVCLPVNDEMTLAISCEFEGHEADIKQAVEAELLRIGERVFVELNGPLSLYASTFHDPTDSHS